MTEISAYSEDIVLALAAASAMAAAGGLREVTPEHLLCALILNSDEAQAVLRRAGVDGNALAGALDPVPEYEEHESWSGFRLTESLCRVLALASMPEVQSATTFPQGGASLEPVEVRRVLLAILAVDCPAAKALTLAGLTSAALQPQTQGTASTARCEPAGNAERALAAYRQVRSRKELGLDPVISFVLAAPLAVVALIAGAILLLQTASGAGLPVKMVPGLAFLSAIVMGLLWTRRSPELVRAATELARAGDVRALNELKEITTWARPGLNRQAVAAIRRGVPQIGPRHRDLLTAEARRVLLLHMAPVQAWSAPGGTLALLHALGHIGGKESIWWVEAVAENPGHGPQSPQSPQIQAAALEAGAAIRARMEAPPSATLLRRGGPPTTPDSELPRPAGR